MNSSLKEEKSNKKKKLKKNALEFVDFKKESTKDPKFKTELCKTYSDNGFCPYGNKCRFAHGKVELFVKPLNHPKYKKSDCTTFHTTGYCAYGIRCHFRHNQNTNLEDVSRSFFSYLLSIRHLIDSEVNQNRLKVFQAFSDRKMFFPMSISNNSRFSQVNNNACCNEPRQNGDFNQQLNHLRRMINVSNLKHREIYEHNKDFNNYISVNRKTSANSNNSLNTSTVSSAESLSASIMRRNNVTIV